MAYGNVHEQFWDDPGMRALSERARYLMLYLLTCRHRNTLGLYVLDPRYIAADLDWTSDEARGTLQELVAAERIVHDPDNRIVFVPRFLRHNTLRNTNVVRKALTELAGLPATPLLDELADAVESAMKEGDREHYKPLLQAVLDKCPNKQANKRPNKRPNKRAVNRSMSLSLSDPDPGPGPGPGRSRPPPSVSPPLDPPPLKRGAIRDHVVEAVDEHERSPPGSVHQALMDHWLAQHRTRPDDRTVARQAKVAQRLARACTVEQLRLAVNGITKVAPHSMGEPWDLFDLERKMAKAMAASDGADGSLAFERGVADTMAALKLHRENREREGVT